MRPTASDVVAPVTESRQEPPHDAKSEMTRAQARALARCAPLTPTQFKTKRLLADQGTSPLERADAHPARPDPEVRDFKR